MKITRIDTIRLKEHPRLLWVLVHTDEGYVGLGETYDKAGPAETAIHEMCADLLLGQNPLDIERLWTLQFQAANYHGYAGAEMRAISAVDIALWDIAGQVFGQPVYRLLGGSFRESVPVYNTCVSFREVRDREAFLKEPERLAQDLLQAGVRAMKIWPFDELSAESFGQRVDRQAVQQALGVVRRIREAVGERMDVAIEGHARWNLTSALQLAYELEPFNPMWVEELTIPDNVDVLVELRRRVRIPIAGSERLFTRFGFRQVIERLAVDVVNPDITWVGGFTEMKKVAALAEMYGLPVSPHNCGGPVSMVANIHFSRAIPNFYILESVRAFYRTYYPEVADPPPAVQDGCASMAEGPGLGVRLRPEVLERADVTVRSSTKRGAGMIHTPVGDPWAKAPGEWGEQ